MFIIFSYLRLKKLVLLEIISSSYIITKIYNISK